MLFFNIENQENYLVPSVIKEARIKVSKVKKWFIIYIFAYALYNMGIILSFTEIG